MLDRNAIVGLVVTSIVGGLVMAAAAIGAIGLVGWLLWRGLMSVVG